MIHSADIFTGIVKFSPKFLEKRRIGLEYFLKLVYTVHTPVHIKDLPASSCILLNPEFSGSPVLKGFLFSHSN
jgi:hypothetical protein